MTHRHAKSTKNIATGSHRVRRSQVSLDTWTKHRKLRKKIASAKWYASKKKRELKNQHSHRDIIDANHRDLHNPEAPWNRIHQLYEWAHWPEATRDYSQLLSVPKHPHAPCLTAIRYQIETTTKPLMDSIWRNIPWEHPSFRERLVQICWREHRHRHRHPVSCSHTSHDTGDDPPHPDPGFADPPEPSGSWRVSDAPHPCCSDSSTSTCAWHTATLASVPGVLYVALSLRYQPYLRHPSSELHRIWRWLAHSLVHIYHPNNPKDIHPHTMPLHPDSSTVHPPNQTPIQKLEHIALQHSDMLNPRSILCNWIQAYCFPSMDNPSKMGVGEFHSRWWWDNPDHILPSPVTQPPTPNEDDQELWDQLRVSDCESSQSSSSVSKPIPIETTWLHRSLDAEPDLSRHDHHYSLSVSDRSLSSDWPEDPSTSPDASPGSHAPTLPGCAGCVNLWDPPSKSDGLGP